MKTGRIATLVAIVAVLGLLAAAGSVIASPPREGPGGEGGAAVASTVGEKINYQGRLTDSGTGSPLDGPYTMRFKLYDAASDGTELWDSGDMTVLVEDGLFNVELNVPQDAFNGQELWLAVKVDGEWMTDRQEILPVPYALSLRPGAIISSPGPDTLHVWNEAGGWAVEAWSQNNIALLGTNGTPNGSPPSGMHGVHGIGDGVGVYGEGGHTGVYGNGTEDGVKGESSDGNAVHGISTNSTGVLGEGGSGENTYGGRFTGWGGVHANAGDGPGVYAQSTSGHGVHVPSAGSHGVDVASANGNGVQVYSAGSCGVRVVSAGNDGVRVDSANWSGVYVGSAGYDAIRVQTAGQDGLRIFDTVGRDYIRAGSDADPDFKVLKTGEVRSDVGFNTPAGDFAEMIDAEGETTSYQPGDVLVVSDAQDRAVALSSTPYSHAVIGVYSTAPGFVGGHSVSNDDQTSNVPLAILGIVPCKVSAENGPIRRGDLLVTSSTPGHAMRADNPSPGTILGKALGELQSGTGVIDVLVTLQ